MHSDLVVWILFRLRQCLLMMTSLLLLLIQLGSSRRGRSWLLLLLLLSNFLLFGCLDPHLAHELFFFDAQLIFPVLSRDYFHLIFMHNDLCYSVVTLASISISSDFLLVDLAPLDDVAKAATHVVEFEVGTCLRARVLAVGVIVEVDPFVVHQSSFIIHV